MTIRIYVNGILVDTKTSSLASPPESEDAALVVDSDIDGTSNYDEELAGTDYNDAYDFPMLEVSGPGELSPEARKLWLPLDGPEVLFTWSSYSNRLYTLEAGYDCAIWQEVPGGVDLPGTGTEMVFTNHFGDMPTLFLRMKIEPRP